MIRWLLLSIAIVSLMAPVGAVQTNESVPQECQVPNSQLTSTEEALCEDLREKNRALQNYRFQLNRTADETNASYFRSVDAWNPRTENPALWIVRTQDPDAKTAEKRLGVFQYVGEGFGSLDIDNDGTKSWRKVPISTEGDPGFGTVTIKPYYTPRGVNESITVPQAAAVSRFQKVADEFNSPQGFAAWQRWRAGKEQSKGTLKTTVLVVFTALIGLASIASIYAEAQSGRLRSFLNEVDKRKRRYDGMHSDISTWRAVMEVLRD